jgi:poly(3-hydroxybutyrate) depolymerase
MEETEMRRRHPHTSTTALLFVLPALLLLGACGGPEDDIGHGLLALGGYSKYVPTQLSAGKVPLVVAIHGCTQNANSFAASTGWNELAERYGFFVLYPDKNGSCWSNRFLGGYSQAEVDQVAGYIGKMRLAHPEIDPAQVYVMGLSAGTGLTNCLLVKRPDLFAGGAPMSGPGCTAAGKPAATAKILIWHTTGDYYSSDLPGVFTSYGKSAGGKLTISGETLKAGAKAHSYDAYTVNGQPRVGLVTLQGMGHGTACDPGSADDQGGCLPGSSYAFDWDLHSAYYTAQFWGILKRDAAPTLTIDSPSVNATVDAAQPVVFRATASDDQAVARVVFSVDGVQLCELKSAPYHCSWAVAKQAPNGHHALLVVAEDSAGQRVELSRTFALINGVQDVTPPTVALLAPAPMAKLRGQVELSAEAKDDFAVTRVIFSVDGQVQCGELVGDAQSVYRCTVDFDALATGTHTIEVKAIDAAGNQARVTREVTSDKPTHVCREFTASNLDHVAAQRATTYFWGVKAQAVGSGDELGLYYSESATLAEIAPGYFVKGSCSSTPPPPPPGPGSFSCRSFTTTNLEHVAAGRAEEYEKWYTPYTRTLGAGDELGLLGSTWYSATTTVSETKPGYFIAGACP